jgi:hypothetical protein
MVADRAYSPGLFAFRDSRASLFYFAAAVPTVGFVHGAADLNPIDAETIESYVERGSMERGPGIDTVGGRSTPSEHASSARRWPLSLRWLA